MKHTKYFRLSSYLRSSNKDELTLSFDEIEKILGFKLPKSARDYPVNWSNTETLTIPFAWLNVGYKTHNVDMINGIVHFYKDGTVPTYAETPSLRKEKNEERINKDMSQKDEILMHLKDVDALTHRELSIKMYGDGSHMPNINESLQALVRIGLVNRIGNHPSYYSLSNKEIDISLKINKTPKEVTYINKPIVVVPTPTRDEVKHYLNEWEKLEDYKAQEEAIDIVFKDYASNDDINNILIKCSILNDFYSTNIFKIYPVAKHILSLNIDERLKRADPTLVNDIAKNSFNSNDKQFYSFASKYCSHHDNLNYPIYDSYVGKVLFYFRKVDNFYFFDKNDLKIYQSFKEILNEFKSFYKLEEFSLKELDRYLWLLGKKYFPKNYKK